MGKTAAKHEYKRLSHLPGFFCVFFVFKLIVGWSLFLLTRPPYTEHTQWRSSTPRTTISRSICIFLSLASAINGVNRDGCVARQPPLNPPSVVCSAICLLGRIFRATHKLTVRVAARRLETIWLENFAKIFTSEYRCRKAKGRKNDGEGY